MSHTLRPALLLVAVATACQARAIAQDPAAVQTVESLVAPVVIDGDTLFSVRGISSLPAERRAARIAEAIRDFAADRTVPVESLAVQEVPLGSLVTAAGKQVFGVVDADAEMEGVSRGVLVEAYRQRVAEAVTRYRRDRDPAVLWNNAVRAILATLAVMLGLWLGFKALRGLRSALDRRYRPRISGVQVGTFEVVPADQLWHVLHRAIGITAAVLAVVAGYLYFNYVLLLFPWTRGLGHSLVAMLLRPLTTLAAGFLRYLPDLVFLAILALVTRWLLKLVGLFFRRLADGSLTLGRFEPEWAIPTGRIVRLLLVAFALVIAYPYIPGSESEAFKGIGLLLGLVFSLGSPSVIGNLVAGQSLAFRRAFRVGDRVKIGEHIGEVAEIRLLTTYLCSPKNEQIVIPNSVILNSEVVNFSTLAAQSGLILHTIVGIGYETPWRQVEGMLVEAASRTPGLLREPAPFVLQKALGTFAVDYEINAYCDNPRSILALYSALHSNILDVFNEYGVQIMTPAYEGDPEQPKVVPPDNWHPAPARVAGGGDGRDAHAHGVKSAADPAGSPRAQ